MLAVREPDTDGDQAPSRVWRFPLRYPDVPHDSEALIVAPSGDKFWVFEKTTESTVPMFGHPGPLVEDQVAVLQETTRFSAPGVPIDRGQMVTAADLHPDGGHHEQQWLQHEESVLKDLEGKLLRKIGRVDAIIGADLDKDTSEEVHTRLAEIVQV